MKDVKKKSRMPNFLENDPLPKTNVNSKKKLYVSPFVKIKNVLAYVFVTLNFVRIQLNNLLIKKILILIYLFFMHYSPFFIFMSIVNKPFLVL